MTLQTYTYFSICVGLLQIYDGYRVHVARGRLSSSAKVFSFFEYAWAGVAIYIIYALWGQPITQLWYPALFVVYVALMAVWGAVVTVRVLVDSKGTELDLDNLPVPQPAMVQAGIVFGALYALCGIYSVMFIL